MTTLYPAALQMTRSRQLDGNQEIGNNVDSLSEEDELMETTKFEGHRKVVEDTHIFVTES